MVFFLLRGANLVKPRSHIACNRSATSLRPKFRVVAGRLQGGCKDTVFSCRPVADRLPTDLQKVSEFLQSKTNAPDTVANQSPTDRQSVADRSLTDRRRVDNHCPITRHYIVNTRSLSAPEPMLDSFSASSNDKNLKAISWKQFYEILQTSITKIDLKINLIFFSNLIIDCLVWSIRS